MRSASKPPSVALFGETPLERLRRGSPRALADTELLALVLPGRRQAVQQKAQELLADQGLGALMRLDESLLHRPGWKPVQAASVLAVVELARRLTRLRIPRRLFRRRDLVANYLCLRYQGCDQEILGALYLDCQERLIAEREIYRGSLFRLPAEPGAILKQALLHGAASFILFHTHPSGDPAPSAEDLSATRRLAEAGDLLGVRLRDHLILGSSGRWVSLQARGY